MPNVDVAVVGAGIAGLTVAAQLTRKGRKVLVTDPARIAGGAAAAFEQDGFRFEAGPLAVYGLEEQGILWKLLPDAGTVGMNASRYQVVLPGRRLTISPEREETLEEIRREFPRELDRVTQLYRDADTVRRKSASGRIAAFLSARRSASSFLRTYRFSPELSAFYEVQALYFFGTPLSALPLSSLVLLLCSSPVQFPAGYARLAEQLVQQVREKGGEVRLGEPWPEIMVKRQRAVGTIGSQGGVEARTVLVNGDIGRPSGERTLFLGVREEVIPVRMENTVLCLPDAHRPLNYYSLVLAQGPGRAPAGMRALAVTAPAALDTPDATSDLRSQIEEIMPFLKDFVVTEREPAPAAGWIALPDRATSSAAHRPVAGEVQLRSRIKNLLLMQDSSRTLLPSLQAALRTADKLG